MSQFRVGQRVRVACDGSSYLGKTATVIRAIRVENTPIYQRGRMVERYTGTRYRVDVDGVGCIGDFQRPISYQAHDLRPLTDPHADAFIERVKKWKSEPVLPLPVKERA